MIKPPLVLVDVSWFAHRARHTMQELSFEDIPTGVLFGFFEQLRTVAFDARIRSNRMVFCFDSRHSYRKDSFPEYKANRAKEKRTPEEWEESQIMRQQVKRLRKEILPSMGFTCLHQTGLESDDLIAQAAEQTPIDPVVIITSDGDLYQCIRGNVKWYDPFRNIYLGPDEFKALKRVMPWDWPDIKALAGCDTDNVPGVPGVGEKTAVDYLWKLLNSSHKRYAAIVSKEGQRIARRNLPLVALPHAATKPVELPDRVYNFTAFYGWCEKLGFASYMEGKRLEQWKMFFRGEFDVQDRMIIRQRVQK